MPCLDGAPRSWIRVQINTPREIGTLVKVRRKEVGLSQTALASLVGASRQWVQNLEGGKPGLELGLTIRALAALGLRLDARPVESPQNVVRSVNIQEIVERAARKSKPTRQ